MLRTLICTADRRTWPSNERPVLFLGEWCRTHAFASEWTKFDHEVLPYHWHDVDARHADYRCLDLLCEKILGQVAEALNEIHGTSHSLRYWRIVVGSWLRYFIGVMYDRFRSLEAALGSGRVDCVPVVSCGRWQRAPRNIIDFLHEAVTDDGNQHIFRTLCALMAPQLLQTVGEESFSRSDGKGRVREWGSLAAFAITSSLSSLSRRRLVASLGYCKMSELAALGFRLGQVLPFPLPRLRPRSFAIDESLRNRLSIDGGGDAFSKLIASTLKEFLPSAYLEGYAAMSGLALRIYPKSVHSIIDDNALHVNDTYKLWAASAVERGAKLAICQHGGFYGSGEWNDDEVQERSICDVFLNWGWEDTSSARPMPSATLSRLLLQRKLPAPSARRIAWVANMFPRYALSQRSMPTAPEVLDYIQDQIRFYRALPGKLASQLWLRPYQKDWDWGFVARLSEAGFDERNICSRKISLMEQLGKSRIGVYTADTTVHLEMFVMNIPTLLYWNRKIWRNRSEAMPYYEALRHAGILHDSPESAAAMLVKVYDDPWTWWSSDIVKDAVCRYLDRFGFAAVDWMREWQARLRNAGLLV